MTEIKKEQTLVDTKLHVLENMCIKEEPVEFDEDETHCSLIIKDEPKFDEEIETKELQSVESQEGGHTLPHLVNDSNVSAREMRPSKLKRGAEVAGLGMLSSTSYLTETLVANRLEPSVQPQKKKKSGSSVSQREILLLQLQILKLQNRLLDLKSKHE